MQEMQGWGCMELEITRDVLVLVVGIWVEGFSFPERQEEERFRGGQGLVQLG